MSKQLQPQRGPNWWARMRRSDRVALVAVLLAGLLLAAALLVLRPDGREVGAPVALPPSPTASAEYPPGTRWYYNRSQWVPFEQGEQP